MWVVGGGGVKRLAWAAFAARDASTQGPVLPRATKQPISVSRSSIVNTTRISIPVKSYTKMGVS